MRRATSLLGLWVVAVVFCHSLSARDVLAVGEIQIDAKLGLPECTHVSLHDGKCATAQTGQLAAITDAGAFTGDRCDVGAKGKGTAYVLCRYDGSRWREFGASAGAVSSSVAGTGAELVLDILNPPIESGLTPPVGDGIDGQPNAPRTDDAPAIQAAILYACENGYDIAYLGPGTYRIGEADTVTSFYTGISIDAKLCPGGIKFYGAGIGQTILLANGDAGQYIIVISDEWQNVTKVRRIGWNTFGHAGDREVIDFTTGVTPPVITGSGNSHLADGDTVFIRNCSGVTQANEQRFKVNNCTGGPPYTCELQDELGVDIDATNWDAWTTDTPCIVHKLNLDFSTEVAYMTLRDDDIEEHMTILCNPLCWVPGEESHGIGILQGGGVVEIHDIMFDRFGDEAIDVSAPESPTYVHDVSIINAVHGGIPVYQGVGIRIEDVWVHKNISSPWDKIGVGSTEYIPYTAGDAFSVNAGSKNWRVLDMEVNRVVATGELGSGFSIGTASSGESGQYISGVKVTNSIFNLIPQEMHCDDTPELCGSFLIASSPGFPMDTIEVSGSYMTGNASLYLEEGPGGVLLKNNTLVPIPTISPQWGIVAGSKGTLIEDNSITGFTRGCILYRPYETDDEQYSTITTTIQRNILQCVSTTGVFDPMISWVTGDFPPQNMAAEGYFHIIDNQFSASSSDPMRRAVSINRTWKNVEICRNTITLGSTLSGVIGIISQSEDQLICDNVISVEGVGIWAEGDGSQIVGNEIHGADVEDTSGILVYGSSNVKVLRNVVTDYENTGAAGIRINSGAVSQSDILIVGNQVGGGRFGIIVNGTNIGLSEISVSDNTIDMNGFAGCDGILLYNVTNALVSGNQITGLTGDNAKGLLTRVARTTSRCGTIWRRVEGS